MKLAIFDVCGTLYRCNTLFTYIRWRMGRLPLPDSFPVKAADSLLRPLGLPLRRLMYVRTLRFMDAQQFQESVCEFAAQVLPQYIRESAVQLLKSLQQNGWRVVLLSGTTDVIVKEVAAVLGVDEFEGSSLEQVNGRLTGRFDDLLAGRKHELLCRYEPYNELFVCTDNRNDLDLLKLADRRRIYCPHRLVKFWRLHGFEMRDLYVDDR